MFTFSFPCPNDHESASQTESSAGDRASTADRQWFPAEKVEISPSHNSALTVAPDTLQSIDLNSLQIVYLSADMALKMVGNLSHSSKEIHFAEAQHSDLIPAKYEGGLKVWECTIDLLNWLFQEDKIVNFEGKRVLDLGCGAGLLGIAAFKHGASVAFQDYNREVIEACTIPNVLCNLSHEERNCLNSSCQPNEPRCEFFCGDWSSFASLVGKRDDKMNKFDFILSSETIYNPENNRKLLNVFKACLKKSGVIYLAAKTYYFGVGGGLRQFEALIAADGEMESEVSWRCSSGVQREVLKITYAPKR